MRLSFSNALVIDMVINISKIKTAVNEIIEKILAGTDDILEKPSKLLTKFWTNLQQRFSRSMKI